MTNPEIEAIANQGKAAFQAGDFASAAKSFEQAMEAALEGGNKPLAAEMANNLSVAYLQNKEPQKALEAAEGTDLIFEAAGDLAKQGMALGNIGTSLEVLKQFENAADHYIRAIELLDQAGETEFRSLVQKSLATIKIRQGDHLGGMTSMQQSFDGQKKLSPRERWLKLLLKLPFKFLGK